MMLNLAAIRAIRVSREPGLQICVPGALDATAVAAVLADFPTLDPGCCGALSRLQYGPGFRALVNDLRSSGFEAALEEKLSLDLSDKPLLITVHDGLADETSQAASVACRLMLAGPAAGTLFARRIEAGERAPLEPAAATCRRLVFHWSRAGLAHLRPIMRYRSAGLAGRAGSGASSLLQRLAALQSDQRPNLGELR